MMLERLLTAIAGQGVDVLLTALELGYKVTVLALLLAIFLKLRAAIKNPVKAGGNLLGIAKKLRAIADDQSVEDEELTAGPTNAAE